jgi:L-asparagine permease
MLVLMAFDHPVGTWTVASLVILIPALIIGWFAARSRVLEVARLREPPEGEQPARHPESVPVDD